MLNIEVNLAKCASTEFKEDESEEATLHSLHACRGCDDVHT